ncbi:MAG: hypothetical protein ABSF15_26325 [Candidatus Sulfotelmatobacter sp.]|jgi:hypothetical protein
MLQVFPTLTRVRAPSFPVLATFLLLLAQGIHANAQTQSEALFTPSRFTEPRDRITNFVDDEKGVTLRGNRHASAIARCAAGNVAPGYPMQHILLTLLPGAGQQDALHELVNALPNPESPSYHQWLTPEPYGEHLIVCAWAARSSKISIHRSTGPPPTPRARSHPP